MDNKVIKILINLAKEDQVKEILILQIIRTLKLALVAQMVLVVDKIKVKNEEEYFLKNLIPKTMKSLYHSKIV